MSKKKEDSQKTVTAKTGIWGVEPGTKGTVTADETTQILIQWDGTLQPCTYRKADIADKLE